MKQCVNNKCNININDTADFCPSCGKKQPNLNAVVASALPGAALPVAAPPPAIAPRSLEHPAQAADLAAATNTQPAEASAENTEKSQEKKSNWAFYICVAVIIGVVRLIFSEDDKKEVPAPASATVSKSTKAAASSADADGFISVKKAKVTLGSNSCRYTGTMLGGVPHGNGTAKCDNWSYTGAFVGGKCSGFGTKTYYYREPNAAGAAPSPVEEHTYAAVHTDCDNADGVYTWTNGSSTRSKLVNGTWNNY